VGQPATNRPQQRGVLAREPGPARLESPRDSRRVWGRTSIGYASRAAAYTSSTGSVHPIVPIETLAPLPNGLQDQVAPWRVHRSIRGSW
jgi:hypothetical protein